MKNVLYEDGPDQIWVGPKNNQIVLRRGVAVPMDDAFADSLLKKPMFKEAKEESGAKGQGSRVKG
jgi:hypothetical protein